MSLGDRDPVAEERRRARWETVVVVVVLVATAVLVWRALIMC